MPNLLAADNEGYARAVQPEDKDRHSWRGISTDYIEHSLTPPPTLECLFVICMESGLPTSRFSNFLFHREPAWRSYRRVPRDAIPTALRPWLLDQGSLTERLIAASGGRFAVEILNQRWELPRLSEIRQLHMKTRELALVREVLLHCREEAWVYARSIIPLSTLTGRLRALRKLSNRPLGALLFNDPAMRRSAIEIACLTPNNTAMPSVIRDVNHPMWGRRSVFTLDQKPLLVSEIFLPTFPPYNDAQRGGINESQ